jgi:predicted nucleic acid-binding protein
MIVADASAIIEALLNTASGVAVTKQLSAPGQTVHVPHLTDVEVLQVLRRYARTGSMGAARARQALDDYSDMRLVRYPHAPLMARIWQLRQNASAYDAVYLALAEALHAPLLTCDRALGSIPGHRAKVLVR